MCINLTWNRRVCVGVAFLCLLCAFLLSFTTLKWIGQQHFAKTKRDGVHFFTLKLECHNSYNNLLLCDSANGDIAWCNKNKSEWGFCVFLKKRTKTCFFSKNTKKRIWKNRRAGIFWKKNGFFSTLTIFQSCFVIFPWWLDLEQLMSLSVWLGVRGTPRAKDHYNEEAENYWYLNT